MSSFRIAADHPCLPGHFPGQPVVPGVVVVDEVLALARIEFGTRPLIRMPQVKFASPLLPEQEAHVEFEPRAERLRFRVLRGEDLIASGELVFAQASEVVAELEVELWLLPTSGCRRTRYRPNHKHPITAEFFLGEIVFDVDKAEPGQCTPARIKVLMQSESLDALLSVGEWTLWEGASQVGSVRLLGVLRRGTCEPTHCREGA